MSDLDKRDKRNEETEKIPAPVERKNDEKVITEGTGAVKKMSQVSYGDSPKTTRGTFQHQEQSRWRANNTPGASWRKRGESESSSPTPSERPWRPTPKWSKKDLLLVARKDPVDAFLEVMDSKEMFHGSTTEENKSHEIVVLLIVILGKIHQVPLSGHLQSLSKLIFGTNVTFRDDILAYVKFVVELEEKDRPNLLPFADQVWSSLESFCSFGRRFSGIRSSWAYFTRAVCGILENRKKDSLVKMYFLFAKLRADYENGCFYSGPIYPTSEDTKRLQTLVFPSMENGKVKDAKEYLDFQFSYMNASYNFDILYNGVQDFLKLEEEQKTDFIVSVGKSFILPRVRILEPNPLIAQYKGKRNFLIDLAPHKRIDDKLPEDIKEKLAMLNLDESGHLLILSTSSAFENIITANQPFVSDESLDQGFLIMNILQMQNVKESIFNKDLVLFLGSAVFESKLSTYKELKKMSTATLPMKEYFVDCQTSAVLSDYENIEEHECSIEKIDLRSEGAKAEQLKVLGMNEKQFEAFQMALTRKLTLIQGPPGTGKTTVALNIIKRLLANTSLKILFVTFRNINLDKFIVDCSTFTDKVVRVGWYTHYKEVDKYTLMRDPHDQDPRYHRIKQDRFYEVLTARNAFVNTMENLQDGAGDCSKTLDDALQNLKTAHSNIDELKPLSMYNKCEEARIIGMTSTGVAKYHELLLILRPSVVIIEEAAVIPESHIITSLTEHTKQLILIGDHTQFTHLQVLYFNINCRETMLMQRLVENNLNNVRLDVQYRMHPDISDLLRGTLYPDLIDGENVKFHLPIRGILKNLFCVTDENLKTLPQETLDLLQKDYPIEDNPVLNATHEMLFCAGLANYLRHQEYQPHEIVILTPFWSEEDVVAQALQPFPLLKDVLVGSMDRCQGDEFRIVILSLSVSDATELSNLLELDYRIRVLLSRAREGLYMVGPIDLYAEKSEIWRRVKAKLEAKGAIGPELPIKCEKHEEKMTATTLEDFLKITRDGCPLAEKTSQIEKHPCFQ